MKLSTLLLATAATCSTVLVSADDKPGTVAPGADATAPTTAPPAASVNSTASSAPTPAGKSPLDGLKQKTYGKEYHMPYIRVVQARVQGDKPELVKGRFVSKFGNGDLAKGYQSAMDTVNMASVEGALMYVQAEGINQNQRSSALRCTRKANMSYVVLYEILIAQTNETIAQFSDGWNVPEYGPMIPMDGGICTPLSGKDVFPPECLQMNGDKGQPNIGPFVGAGLKHDDVRAPYPNTFWFSFPHTCPLKVWGEKNDPNNACRASTRKGLCDMGQAPDGFNCTYTYDILGWVPIDDVVGITDLKDDSGNNYKGFESWCKASDEHVEFAGNERNGEREKGLPFWEDPLNATRNSERAAKVVTLYQDILAGDFKSSQIDETDLKNFKDLPNPKNLAEMNPPCYRTVPKCNSGNGCKRTSFSQICMPCKDGEGCKTDPSFTFPTLEKAKTVVAKEELSSGSKLGGALGATGSVTDTLKSSSSGNSTKAPSATSAATGSSVVASVAALAVASVVVLAL